MELKEGGKYNVNINWGAYNGVYTIKVTGIYVGQGPEGVKHTHVTCIATLDSPSQTAPVPEQVWKGDSYEEVSIPINEIDVIDEIHDTQNGGSRYRIKYSKKRSKRRSTKRRSTKRRSTKRRSTKRKSKKRKYKKTRRRRH